MADLRSMPLMERSIVWMSGRSNLLGSPSKPLYRRKDTCSFVVCMPLGTSTTISVPRAVATVWWLASTPLSRTVAACVPVGSIAPTASAALRSCEATVVVSIEALRTASTSMEPWPNLMSEPETALCPTGICGITATALRPRSGDTPSSKCTTGHSTPYVPQACRPMDRSVNFLSMLAPKAGDGEVSGIAPGTSHTAGVGRPGATDRRFGNRGDRGAQGEDGLIAGRRRNGGIAGPGGQARYRCGTTRSYP